MQTIPNIIVYLRIFESIQILAPGIVGLLLGCNKFSELFSPAVAFYLFAYFIHHIFVNAYNDYCDYEADRSNPRKKSKPIVEKRTLYRVTCFLFVATLIIQSFLPFKTAVILLFLEIIAVAYSHPVLRLKTFVPMAQMIHFLGGFGYLLSGVFLLSKYTNATELWVGAYFGLIYLSGGLNNELLDFDYDMASGLFTTATRIGKKSTLVLVVTAQILGILALLGGFQDYQGKLGVGLLVAFYMAVITYLLPKKLDQSHLLNFRKKYRFMFSCFTGSLIIYWIHLR